MAMGQRFQQCWSFLTEAHPAKPPPSPAFDRFCIIFMAIDWIVFGSMHFSLHEYTRGMLPYWVPLPDAVVVVSGIAEVTVGMLALYGRTRRVAAIGSLALLILLTPAIFHILYDNNALPFDPTSWPARLWRLLGIPHTVLMAICSLHLVHRPYPSPLVVVGLAERSASVVLVGHNLAALMVAFILLLCNAAGFLAVLVGVNGDKPTGFMWMMMCLAIGGLLGFLFAVPRTSNTASGRAILRPNRNIEAISDWLTKILVGLGLVNFKEIGRFLAERASFLAPSLKVDDNYALALIIYFSIAGFLEGYLLTRMFLQRHFEDPGETTTLHRRV